MEESSEQVSPEVIALHLEESKENAEKQHEVNKEGLKPIVASEVRGYSLSLEPEGNNAVSTQKSPSVVTLSLENSAVYHEKQCEKICFKLSNFDVSTTSASVVVDGGAMATDNAIVTDQGDNESETSISFTSGEGDDNDSRTSISTGMNDGTTIFTTQQLYS